MCGCMLMHAAMDHSDHATADQPLSLPQADLVSGSARELCVHCSFPLQPGFAFCPNCGMSLKTAQCPACGRKIDPAWSACVYCGSPLGEAEKSLARD